MKVFELLKRYIAPVVMVCCFVCFGSLPLQAQVQVNDLLQVTPNSGNQVGSAWATQQTVVNGFTTTFTFQFTNGTTPPGDGIAFVIQNAPAGLAAIGFTGGNGGAIGYGNRDAS